MKTFWQRFLGNPSVIVGMAWLGLVVVVSLLADVLAPRDPFSIVGTPFIRPGHLFWLGTDSLGRDVLAGLMHGALCFRGARVPVELLWSDLRSGHSIEDFLFGCPAVTREQVETYLELAQDLLLECAAS